MANTKSQLTTDEKLEILQVQKRELCAKFRRELSHLLDLENALLGLNYYKGGDEIEIYY